MNEELRLLPRIAAALLAGAAIGWERQRHQKPAGLRTHALVAAASALLMLLAELLAAEPGSRGDPLRIAQGILTGIGFIGAGTIIHAGRSVIGLTTASTIWLAAALGLVAGAGFYVLTVAGTALTLAVLLFLRYLERAAPHEE
jgi:putative Mg2+ transporter-C (MgtC) family protein